MNQSVAAVIVTYNRKALLRECLNAVLSQNAAVEKIILIDNASTDGTQQMLRENGFLSMDRLQYICMETNTGGSGGFYEGLKIGRDAGTAWLWLMDDDTIPQADTLRTLLTASEKLKEPSEQAWAASLGRQKDQVPHCGPAAQTPDSAGEPAAGRDALHCGPAAGTPEPEKISFLASCVYGPGGECMNVPKPDRSKEANGSEGWYRHLGQGLLRIESATFVSVLIHTDAVKRCGLPCRDYFIWGDDVEYTNRLTHYYGKAYLVGASAAIHKRANARALDISCETDPDRIRMLHCDYRNQAINNRFYKKGMGPAANTVKNMIAAARILREEQGWLKARTILRGTFEALTQYSKFRDDIMQELEAGAGASSQQ